MTHVGPEFIRFDPLDFLRFGRRQRLALDFLKHPVHHRVVADPHSRSVARNPTPSR